MKGVVFMLNENVAEFYTHDHDELDDFLKEYQHLKRSDFMKAKSFFRSFKFGLQRHILWEEEILFPFFEQKTGLKEGGPCVVMRQEHKLIKEALEKLHEKVRRANPDSEVEEQELIDLLRDHNLKEEQILYPMIDRVSSKEERIHINEQMNAISKDRYEYCGCKH